MVSKYVWSVVPPLGEAALFVMGTIRSATGLEVPVDDQFAGAIVVMMGLSFIWGVVYHVGRHAAD